MNVLLIGGPGSGKGTLGKYLSSNESIRNDGYEGYHVSTGELFRFHMSNDTEIGLQVKEIINAGGLAKDDITVKMMGDEINKIIDNKLPFSMAYESGIVFDGFPRTLAQGPLLDELLINYKMDLDFVFYLEASDEILMERLKGRALVEDRPEDGDEEYCKKRIAVFHKQTKELIDFYQERGILYKIDASKSIEEVNAEVVKIMAV